MIPIQHSVCVLDTYEAARYLGLKNPGTLCNWRTDKKGPPFVRIGGNVRYLKTDLNAWLDDQRVIPSNTLSI